MLDTLTIPTSASPSTDVKQFWNYFASHRVSASWHSNGATDVSYNIDNLDRIIQRTVGGYPYDIQRAYTYDGLGRLRAYADSAWVDNSEWYCPTLYEIDCYWIYNWSRYEIRSDTFAFDAVGNHTLKSASVGTGNRLTYFNGFTMTYDADGNMRTKISSTVRDTLDWNVLGQLERLSHTTGGTTTITTFGYDGLGRRVRKTVGGTTKRYLVDGDHVVTELDGSGNRVRDYSYLPGMDRPQSMVQHSGGAAYYFAQEEPGHVTRLLNSSGTVVNSYEYGPFGEPQYTSETIAQPLQYMGRERDEAGYYFVRARYYDPDLGRFISEDPIGLAGGINPYAYVSNDPANSTDPTGLIEPDCIFTAFEFSWGTKYICNWGGGGQGLPPVVVTGINNPGGTFGPRPGFPSGPVEMNPPQRRVGPIGRGTGVPSAGTVPLGPTERHAVLLAIRQLLRMGDDCREAGSRALEYFVDNRIVTGAAPQSGVWYQQEGGNNNSITGFITLWDFAFRPEAYGYPPASLRGKVAHEAGHGYLTMSPALTTYHNTNPGGARFDAIFSLGRRCG